MRVMPVHEGAFTVLLVCDCSPSESEHFANRLADFVETRSRTHSGFVSSLVYLSEDAQQVVLLMQWARGEDWETYRRSEDGRNGAELLIGRRSTTQYLEMVRGVPLAPPG